VAFDTGNFSFVGIYKGFKLPTNMSQNDYVHSLLSCLTEVYVPYKKVIIGGDFNIDHNKHSPLTESIMDWSISLGLSQLIKTNTRTRIVTLQDQTQRKEESLIDHLYTNTLVNLKLLPSISDHLMIEVIV